MKATLTNGIEHGIGAYCPYCKNSTLIHVPGCPYVHVELLKLYGINPHRSEIRG